MFICVCTYAYVCMYVVYMYVCCVYVCMYLNYTASHVRAKRVIRPVCEGVYVCMYACMHVHQFYLSMYVFMHVCMYISSETYHVPAKRLIHPVCKHVYVCTYVCMYISSQTSQVLLYDSILCKKNSTSKFSHRSYIEDSLSTSHLCSCSIDLLK